MEPLQRSSDEGIMITVFAGGGIGYGATSDLSPAGIKRAATSAADWAKTSAARTVIDFSKIAMPRTSGRYASRTKTPWLGAPLTERVNRLRDLCAKLKTSNEVVDWSTGVWAARTESLLLTDSGSEIEQTIDMIMPGTTVRVANAADTQTRSLGGYGNARQGGAEALDDLGFWSGGERVTQEALQLLAAPNCPAGVMDVLLAPDQMILQIHESIGHPLELDRILGDERNYAGRSFVSLDMLGTYQYGSPLLNITFDPTIGNQIASYAFDDEGTPATREFVIRNGILERALGGTLSQQRAGKPGVANSRAVNWNRPAIDRMANLNLEPGTSTMEEMVSQIERGVLLKTNNSWSIDDSRNKFQFGCEWGQLIENGKLTSVVKNPCYRGISATFWRNLKAVGNSATNQLMGTPNCGKGEPNQAIPVGHASPPCVFSAVDVFGGEA